MKLLVEKDTFGHILSGSDEKLLDCVGDDLCLHIQSQGYNETIMFGNYVVIAGRVSGLSLPHLNHGDLSEPARLEQESICTVEYIYDSECNNLIAKDMLDGPATQLTAYAHNPSYRRYAWYATRRYVEADPGDLDQLIAIGDQFKLMLHFAGDLRLVLDPDIIYFPDRDRRYLVKSAAMVLPADFVTDPQAYGESGRPLIENDAFYRAYLNVDANGLLTIIHKQRYYTDAPKEQSIREGALSRHDEGPTLITRVQCEHTILVPEK